MQGDQSAAGATSSRRRRNKKKRRRRSAEPNDIEDDINSVTSRLMDKKNKGMEVQFGELINEVSNVMVEHIEYLKKEVANINTPKGTRENPASTCREIKMGHEGSKDGWYYIDPNEGSSFDAMKVYCNMSETVQTCVYPTQRTKKVDEKQYKANGRQKTFKQLNDGFEIRYGSSIQMDFLRLLSEKATQRFTYLCSGSVAWYDQVADAHTSAIDLIGNNDYEFETENFNERQIVHDGCKDREMGGFTTFEITTSKLGRLPIVNFRPKDYGEHNQKFGFEAGAICFS